MIEHKNIEDYPPVLTAREAAEILRVNRKTIYEWKARGDLPVITTPGCVRISRDKLKEMLERGEIGERK